MLAKKHVLNPNRFPRMKKLLKSPKQMERHLKGIANHRRIEILFLIARNKGITVDNIAEKLDCNIKTISGHTKRLSEAGLVNKSYFAQAVKHELSPYGKILYDFLGKFQNI